MPRWIALALMVLGCAACGSSQDRIRHQREQIEQLSPSSQLLRALAEMQRQEKAGQHERAVELLVQACTEAKSALGERHPEVSRCLELLGSLLVRNAESAWAEQLYPQVLHTLDAELGIHHPRTVALAELLIRMRIGQKRPLAALPLIERDFLHSEQRLRQEVFGFSEGRVAEVLRQLRASEERIYSLASEYPHYAAIRKLALSVALLRKGRSIEELSRVSRILNRGLFKQGDVRFFEQLQRVRAQEVNLLLTGPDPSGPAQYQQALSELVRQREELEASLPERVALTGGNQVLPAPTEILARVRTAMPVNSVLIEFIAYQHNLAGPGAEGTGSPDGGPRYLSLLAFKDGRTHVVDLGPAEHIDKAAAALHEAVGSTQDRYLTAARQLHELIFQPLQPLLGETQQLLLSPDGQLSLVPFAALFDGQGFLIDAFDIIYVTSGRDLLPRSAGIVGPRSVVAVVDPDFDSGGARPSEDGAPRTRSVLLQQFFAALPSRFSRQYWQRLPGTLKEGEFILRLLPRTQLLQGEKATKQFLLDLAAPGILHIATHGFFLDDGAAPLGSRAVVDTGLAGSPILTWSLPDPLLRSGIVLAGAHESAASSVVTALELAGLNLWGTQLVVLSACDTGRGDIQPGQGVYGLRRALMVAGTETLVTSLWKVNDETTRELMEGYYGGLLEGQGRASAMRAAMRGLRQKHPHPRYWAPFIVIGQDAPLKL